MLDIVHKGSVEAADEEPLIRKGFPLSLLGRHLEGLITSMQAGTELG